MRTGSVCQHFQFGGGGGGRLLEKLRNLEKNAFEVPGDDYLRGGRLLKQCV